MTDGTLHLQWEAPYGVDRYEIARDFEVIAQVDGDATVFIDDADFLTFEGAYTVSSYVGDEKTGYRTCRVEKRNATRFENIEKGADDSTIEIKFRAGYMSPCVARVLYCDGEEIAVLPGNTKTFSYTFAPDDVASKTMTIQGLGEDFFSLPISKVVYHPSQEGAPFLRGDINSDGTVSIADAVFLNNMLFNWRIKPQCNDAADTNDDGTVNLADTIGILVRLFSERYVERAIFPEPYPIPGQDPTYDQYLCEQLTITPGQQAEDLIAIGELDAGVGQDVVIPVYLTHSTAIEAFQVIVKFDPDQLSFEGSRDDILDFSDSIIMEFYDGEMEYKDISVFEEEGYLIVAGMRHFVYQYPIAPGENQLLFSLRGRISDDVEVGDTIAIAPYNGEDNEGVGVHRLRNEVTRTGEARYLSLYPRTKGGAIRIKDNPLTLDFLRGDANCDGRVDLADVIFTLNYLYQVGVKPACTDAADANDDGGLDLSDPIYVLDFLFGDKPKSGPGEMSVSFGECHPDRTNDSLRGCVYEFCPRN